MVTWLGALVKFQGTCATRTSMWSRMNCFRKSVVFSCQLSGQTWMATKSIALYVTNETMRHQHTGTTTMLRFDQLPFPKSSRPCDDLMGAQRAIADSTCERAVVSEHF
eukprot:1173468-Prorocentrum_minimum.AAC.1